ncbi:MAG: Crp/Fnr family transcriptional regulator [Bacteroides sp.]|nr:Crp/Fnr family transcriptional regulator [Bacteroides sp.]
MTRLNDFMTRFNVAPLLDFCREHGRVVAYHKGESMVDEGYLCRYFGFVRSGYFKYTVQDSEGNECVTGFSFEGEVVADYVRSFLFSQPSLVSIIAGCDSEVLQVRMSDIRNFIKKHNPEIITEASSILMLEAYERYLSIHRLTPIERYRSLFPRFADVIDRIPYQEIASYLSISRRQFQRIRAQI